MAIIPARYQSTRFPGKMLSQIGEKSLIQHVFDRVVETGYFLDVYVATDHIDIQKSIEAIGAKVIMTDPNLSSGTDRIIAALPQIDMSYDYVVNVQGDEALISKEQLGPLVTLLNSEQEIDIATLYTKNTNEEDFLNPNCVKLTKDSTNKILYFSRSPIPFNRDDNFTSFYQHIGVYALSPAAISRIPNLAMSSLEESEKLEQLRWMQAGMNIYGSEVTGKLIGVDTKEDLERVSKLLL